MEEASERKKRLREMREKAQAQAEAEAGDKPQLKFRNYKPQDKALRPAEPAANDENKQDNSAARLNPIQRELQAQVRCVAVVVWQRVPWPGQEAECGSARAGGERGN
jgi:hypothetical protein